MSMYDDDVDDEQECPGEEECEDTYCDQLQDYEVTYSYEVTAQVRAHSENEAEQIADDVGMQIRLELPDQPHDLVDELSVSSDGETLIENVREKMARDLAFRQEVDRMMAEEEASAESSNS